MATNWQSFDPRKPWLLKPEDGAGQQQSPDYWSSLYGGQQQQGGAPPAGTVNTAAPPPQQQKQSAQQAPQQQAAPVNSQTVAVPPAPGIHHNPAPPTLGTGTPAVPDATTQPVKDPATQRTTDWTGRPLNDESRRFAWDRAKDRSIDPYRWAVAANWLKSKGATSLTDADIAAVMDDPDFRAYFERENPDYYQNTPEQSAWHQAALDRHNERSAGLREVRNPDGSAVWYDQDGNVARWHSPYGVHPDFMNTVGIGGSRNAGGGMGGSANGGGAGGGWGSGGGWGNVGGSGAGGGGGAGGGYAAPPVQDLSELLSFFRSALGSGRANLPQSLGAWSAPAPGFDNGQGFAPSAGPTRTSSGPGAAERTAAYRTAPGTFQGEALSGDLTRFAREGLNNPSRYDANLVKQGLSVADAELAKKGAEAERGLDDKMASRGLLGSSIELDENYGLKAELERQRQARAFDLNREQATTWAQDRSAAAGTALGVGEFQRGLGQDRARENQFAWGANRQAGRDAEDDRRYRADFGEDQHRFDTTTGLQKDAMRQRESEFTRSIKDSQVRFAVDNQMKARAMELQRFGMESDVALKQAGQELEANTKAAALALQQQGMQKDDAYRYAALSQDGRFREMALKLQGEGMRLDEAFRRAELQWKQEYGNKELGLKEQSLANDEKFQRVYALLELFKMMQDDKIDPKVMASYYKQVTGQEMPPTTGSTTSSDDYTNPDTKTIGGKRVTMMVDDPVYGRTAITEDGTAWVWNKKLGRWAPQTLAAP